jgi:HlyD family secretion protein
MLCAPQSGCRGYQFRLVLAVAIFWIAAIGLSGCGWRPARVEAKETSPGPSPAAADGSRQIRATGTIQAVRASTVMVPQLSGQQSRVTLVRLIPNGTRVKVGDLLAEFDRTQQVDLAREARAKFEDLTHQVDQKEATNRNDAEKRSSELSKAEADLAKAEIQLKKGPVLNEIDRLKNEEKAASARERVISLKKSDKYRRIAEDAALNVLRLQRERQKVALERADRNAEKLLLKATLEGMVALETLWRGGSMGNAQEGDQLWTGQALLKIFDPGGMEVRTLIGEPDGGALKPGAVATVYVDAYPDATFKAHFHSASPVATAALGSPIKNFTARFRLDTSDPRLLPDLSAAVILQADQEEKR